jgi:RNA-directed DNA polymerase
VVSPLLLNVALHGMENAAGVRYQHVGSNAAAVMAGSPVLIRYADLCRARHKSAYAESRIMPTLMADGLASWLLAVPGSA